jgi:hypothetical protein
MNNKKLQIASILSGSLLMLGIPAIAIAQGAPMTQTLIAQRQAGQVTVGNLISALNNINVQINNLEALNDLTVANVQVVDVDNVLNDNNVRALENALSRNDVEILNLRNVLNDSEIVQNVLNNNDVDVNINEVVAIDVLSDGTVIFFVE